MIIERNLRGAHDFERNLRGADCLISGARSCSLHSRAAEPSNNGVWLFGDVYSNASIEVVSSRKILLRHATFTKATFIDATITASTATDVQEAQRPNQSYHGLNNQSINPSEGATSHLSLHQTEQSK